MMLNKKDIELTKAHTGAWSVEPSLDRPAVVYEIEVRERGVLVEKELKHQRDPKASRQAGATPRWVSFWVRDRTVEVAKAHGVDHVVGHTRNQGLAKGFMTGLNACLARGADVIVNTDADNQYNADDIPTLTAPVVEGKADIVVGARPIKEIEHFSLAKKLLQKLGSWVVRVASRTDVPDAPSSFRAISRAAAEQLVVFNDYTYTLETIIKAGQKNMAITSVPIRVNDDLRPSRLVKSIPSYIRRSIFTIIRIFVVYRPFRFFGAIGAALFLMGFLIGLRFLWHWLVGEGDGHIQSLILAALLMGMGFQTVLVAFLADLLAANPKLLEEVRYLSRRNRSKETRG